MKQISSILASVSREIVINGGLVRAYSAACKQALEEAKIVTKTAYGLFHLAVNYVIADKIKYHLQQHSRLKNIDYTDLVNFYFYHDPANIIDLESKL